MAELKVNGRHRPQVHALLAGCIAPPRTLGGAFELARRILAVGADFSINAPCAEELQALAEGIVGALKLEAYDSQLAMSAIERLAYCVMPSNQLGTEVLLSYARNALAAGTEEKESETITSVEAPPDDLSKRNEVKQKEGFVLNVAHGVMVRESTEVLADVEPLEPATDTLRPEEPLPGVEFA